MEQVVEISTEIEKNAVEQQIAELSLEVLGHIGGGLVDVQY
jgi:hypothetical protein